MSWSLVSGSWGALGLWGGLTAVGGEPSLPPSSSSPPLPTRRSWEARLRGSPFQVGPGTPPGRPPQRGPGHQSDRRGIRLRKGRADPEEVLCPAPFHPGWEPTPGMPIWAFASPCRPGREDLGLSCVTSCTPLPVSGPQLPQLLPIRLGLVSGEVFREVSSFCPL